MCKTLSHDTILLLTGKKQEVLYNKILPQVSLEVDAPSYKLNRAKSTQLLNF